MSKAIWIVFMVVVLILVGGGIYYFSSPGTNTDNMGTSQDSGQNIVQNGNPNSAAGTQSSVSISGFAFSPATLNVKVGDSVTWTNEDSASHTVTSSSGSELNSVTLSNGGTYSHTFSQAGTYAYHCTIHPSMQGKVVVS